MQGALRAVLVGMAVIALAGCGGGDSFQDLRAFMGDVDAQPRGGIEPLPEFQAYRPFRYSAAGLRSPFEPPVVKKPQLARQHLVPPPNPNRVRQYLEQFPIGSLAMVGTISKPATPVYALIKDGQGGVHRVTRGDYLGQNQGRISAINDTGIEIVEVVTDGSGGWIERPRTMALAEN